MAKQGGGIGRISLRPSSQMLADNIARVEALSDQSTDGSFGSSKSQARVYEIFSDDPHALALQTAEILARGGIVRNLAGKGWIADFGGGSAVTYRYWTESVKTMPGVVLTVRDGKSREVYEFHYLPSTRNEK
jgi:hypothetical protein